MKPKCDLHTQRESADGEAIYPQCSRERTHILTTRWGRLGLCDPCGLLIREQMKEPPQVKKNAEVVDLGEGTKGRRYKQGSVFRKYGMVLVEEFPQ